MAGGFALGLTRMTHSKWWLLVAGLSIGLVTGCTRSFDLATPTSQLSALNSLKTGPQVGEMAPSFTLVDETGNNVSLEAMRGTPVLPLAS